MYFRPVIGATSAPSGTFTWVLATAAAWPSTNSSTSIGWLANPWATTVPRTSSWFLTKTVGLGDDVADLDVARSRAGVLGAEADGDDRDLLVAEAAGGDQRVDAVVGGEVGEDHQPGDPLVVLCLRASRPRASRCRARSPGPAGSGAAFSSALGSLSVVSNR